MSQSKGRRTDIVLPPPGDGGSHGAAQPRGVPGPLAAPRAAGRRRHAAPAGGVKSQCSCCTTLERAITRRTPVVTLELLGCSAGIRTLNPKQQHLACVMCTTSGW